MFIVFVGGRVCLKGFFDSVVGVAGVWVGMKDGKLNFRFSGSLIKRGFLWIGFRFKRRGRFVFGV